MMTGRMEVVLTGPAKIDGVMRRAGERVTLGHDLCAELAATGAIGEIAPAPDADAFDLAVAAKAEAIATSMLDAAIAEVERAAKVDLVAARARIDELESQLAKAQAPATQTASTLEAAPAPKPDNKTAAKAATKG